jgi:hypothetical protein
MIDFRVIGRDGEAVLSQHAERIEDAIAVCRAAPGSFVLKVDGAEQTPICQPTEGDALARWLRARRPRRERETSPPPKAATPRPAKPRKPAKPRTGPAPGPKPPLKRDAAVAWLRDALSRGPVPAVELDARAIAAGLGWHIRGPEVRRTVGAVVFRSGAHWRVCLVADLPPGAKIRTPPASSRELPR